MSPVPCAPGTCHSCPTGQLAPLAHLWEAPVPGLGSTILLLPGAGQLLHTLFSLLLLLLLLPRAIWVTSASLAYQDPRYCAWGGVFWVLQCRLEAGILPGGAILHRKGGGGCCSLCSSQISATAQRCPLLTPQRMLTRLLPPCLGFAAGTATSGSGQENQGGVFQDTEENLLGGCPHPTGKHPIFCVPFSPACLLQLLSTLHPQGWK